MICLNDDLHILAKHKYSPFKLHSHNCFGVRCDLEMQQESESGKWIEISEERAAA